MNYGYRATTKCIVRVYANCKFRSRLRENGPSTPQLGGIVHRLTGNCKFFVNFLATCKLFVKYFTSRCTDEWFGITTIQQLSLNLTSRAQRSTYAVLVAGSARARPLCSRGCARMGVYSPGRGPKPGCHRRAFQRMPHPA